MTERPLVHASPSNVCPDRIHGAPKLDLRLGIVVFGLEIANQAPDFVDIRACRVAKVSLLLAGHGFGAKMQRLRWYWISTVPDSASG